MNISRNKLQEILKLYLNDVYDYGTEKEFILTESILNPYRQLLTENKTSAKDLITEMSNNKKNQNIISDFFIYFNEYQKEYI